MTKTRLLIDGDIVAFVSAAAVQHNLMDDFGYVQPFAYSKEGEATVENMLWSLRTNLNADEVVIVLSDPEDNWRRSVDPTYKTNRVGARPLLLDYLKGYLREAHGAEHCPSLEADDTLSILATTASEPWGYLQCVCGMPRPVVGCERCTRAPEVRQIVVGRDKDFRTIPGLHHSWKQDVDSSGKMLVREVSPWEAKRFHLMQSLAGDRVDGFDGCPGIGMERAAKIIDNPVRLVPQEGVKTRGVNKGEAVTRWMSEPTKDYWACIVSHYRKQGLTEADALRTARLANLLNASQYDRETQRITLWTPEMIRA